MADRGGRDGGRGGLAVLAIASTAAYLGVATGYPVLARRLPRSGLAPSRLQLSYLDGRGVLREVLSRITAAGFDVSDLSFQRTREEEGGDPRAVAVQVEVRGRYALTELVSELGELDGVLTVHAADANADPD